MGSFCTRVAASHIEIVWNQFKVDARRVGRGEGGEEGRGTGAYQLEFMVQIQYFQKPYFEQKYTSEKVSPMITNTETNASQEILAS